MIFHGATLAFQNSYLVAAEGTIDTEFVDGLTDATVLLDDIPGTRRYWRKRKSTFRPAIVAYVDGLLELETESARDLCRISELKGDLIEFTRLQEPAVSTGRSSIYLNFRSYSSSDCSGLLCPVPTT